MGVKRALFDRTTLFLVNDYLQGGISNSSIVAYENTIYATLLWDSIIVNAAGSTSSKSLNGKIATTMTKTKDILEKNGISYLQSVGLDYRRIISSLKKYNPDEEYQRIKELADVIFYQQLSYIEKADLFLSLPRQNIIQRYGLNDKTTFNRLQPIIMIEKDILQYYLDFQTKYGIEGIKINTPLLIDYVVGQSKDKIDALKVAKQLSNEEDIIAFKKAMDDLENCINEKRIMEVDRYLRSVNDIVPDLLKKYSSKKDLRANINLQFNVPFSFGGELEGLNIIVPDLQHRRNIGFLIRLAKYGLLRRYEPAFSLTSILYNTFDSLYDKYIFIRTIREEKRYFKDE